MIRLRPALLFSAAFAAAAALSAQAEPAPRGPEADLQEMVRDVESIMGLRAKKPISREVISRGEINTLVAERLREETSVEEISQEELFLRLFGFVDDGFDLTEQVVDVMTEQATALYDYETRKLYLATWTPEDMQQYSLVHEIAHAIADQHFDLGKYAVGGGSADEDLARSAVIEGQASWVMTEWVMRKSGRSLTSNRLLAETAAMSSRAEVEKYPVYSTAPLYIRESMLFPYSNGLLFQQALIEKYGREAFVRAFKNPPETTQHILDPDTYFQRVKPTKPALPPVRLPGLDRTSRGDIGRLDHQVLIHQYFGEEAGRAVGEGWRGGRYEIYQDESRDAAVLRYASDWESEEAARRFFDAYVRIIEGKWERFEVHRSGPGLMEGLGDGGRYTVRKDGATVTSVEGVPEAVYRAALESEQADGEE